MFIASSSHLKPWKHAVLFWKGRTLSISYKSRKKKQWRRANCKTKNIQTDQLLHERTVMLDVASHLWAAHSLPKISLHVAWGLEQGETKNKTKNTNSSFAWGSYLRSLAVKRGYPRPWHSCQCPISFPTELLIASTHVEETILSSSLLLPNFSFSPF